MFVPSTTPRSPLTERARYGGGRVMFIVIIAAFFQLPVFDLRSDGSDNFVTSLLMAGNYCIPEVTILFHNKLLRGNRTVKVDCESFAAFDSPNMPPLAVVGIDINGTYTINVPEKYIATEVATRGRNSSSFLLPRLSPNYLWSSVTFVLSLLRLGFLHSLRTHQH
jgi:hypothetical protein